MFRYSLNYFDHFLCFLRIFACTNVELRAWEVLCIQTSVIQIFYAVLFRFQVNRFLLQKWITSAYMYVRVFSIQTASNRIGKYRTTIHWGATEGGHTLTCSQPIAGLSTIDIKYEIRMKNICILKWNTDSHTHIHSPASANLFATVDAGQ